MFEPINRVERLMQAAAADPKQIPGFYAALLEAEFFVLTGSLRMATPLSSCEGSRISWLTSSARDARNAKSRGQ